MRRFSLWVLMLVAAAVAVGCARDGGTAPAPIAVPPGDSSSPGVGPSVGLRAPSFRVDGLDGRQVTDADFHVVNKPYILYFYASW